MHIDSYVHESLCAQVCTPPTSCMHAYALHILSHCIPVHDITWRFLPFQYLPFCNSVHPITASTYYCTSTLIAYCTKHRSTHTHIIYTHILYVYKYYYFYIYICIYIVHLIYTPLHIYRKQLKDDFLNWSPRLPDEVIETSGRGRL